MLFFFLLQNWRREGQNRSCLGGKLVPMGGGGRWEEGVGGWICCKYCIHMYENGKMIPVETVPGMGGRRD
jgi:hypothetical protein